MDKAGAGNYFIKVAFSLLGHFSGGPAKAAVVASAMTGLISGSSIANVVTTGTFTIPMMKRVGFSSEKAGAVEVASSVNGQIMPPVMGAAAFLMVEYVGISYFEVVKHAFLPALISYIALVYIVHLEAQKAKMEGLPRRGEPKPFVRWLMGMLFGFIAVAALAMAVYYGIGWIKPLAGDAAGWVIAALLCIVYIGLAVYCARYPELELDDPNSPVVELPEVGPTVKSGLHYILPVIVLVWCLMVERLSPGLSAFWATAFPDVRDHHPAPALRDVPQERRSRQPRQARLRRADRGPDRRCPQHDRHRHRHGDGGHHRRRGGADRRRPGLGQPGGDPLLRQHPLDAGLTAVLSLILGMGLPTTANYIVVSSLLAPVIVTLGQQTGLIVPLIAVHLFVFYFGIMADVTPPVGLASFAAAAVSGGDPIKTGFVAFFYSLRTAALPFLFIFNTDLLLIDVGWIEGIFIFIVATIAMLIFAAATQGYFVARSRIYESALLLLIAFTLFRPGFWMDMIFPPFYEVPASQLVEVANSVPSGEEIRLKIDGFDDVGNPRAFVAILPLGEGETGEDKLFDAGLETYDDDGKLLVDNVTYDSKAQAAGLDFDQVITAVLAPQATPPKQLMFIPALVVLALIYVMQRRRRNAEA